LAATTGVVVITTGVVVTTVGVVVVVIVVSLTVLGGTAVKYIARTEVISKDI